MPRGLGIDLNAYLFFVMFRGPQSCNLRARTCHAEDKQERRSLDKKANYQNRKNKALIKRYFSAYDTDDMNAVLKFVHPNHVHHPGAGEPMNFAQRRYDDAFFFRAFSKIHAIVEDQIGEGSKVVSRVTMEANHTGEYQGIRPTGKRIKITFIDIARITSGKIVEEWTEFDMMSIIRQLEPKQ